MNFKGKRVGVVRLEEGPSFALAQVVPEDRDPYPIAMGILLHLDGGLLISFFDDSARWRNVRQASIDSVLAMVPVREGVED